MQGTRGRIKSGGSIGKALQTYNALHDDDQNGGVELSDFSSSPDTPGLDESDKNSWKNEMDITTGVDLMASPESDILNKSSWISCYINLTSTILGAGMLGMVSRGYK
jgi:hypothetical protein